MASLTRPTYHRFLLLLFMTLLFAVMNATAQEQITPAAIPDEEAKARKNAAEQRAADEKQVRDLHECSLAKTNKSCRLIIDRARPLSPPAVQMYSDQALTVVVRNPKPFERYFLDYQSGQAALSPDVASNIVTSLLPSLAKLNALYTAEIHLAGPGPAPPCAVKQLTSDPLPKPGEVEGVVHAFELCLGQLAGDAIDIYRELEPAAAPDSLTPAGPPKEINLADLAGVQKDMTKFLKAEIAISSRITNIAAIDKIKSTDGPAVQDLTNLQKLVDGVAADLTGYNQRIADLQKFPNGFDDFHDCKNLIDKADGNCIWITSKKDESAVYHNMVTRTITYSLNSLNLISISLQAAPDPTKKKLVATIAINFADEPAALSGKSVASAFRWEASAGAFFSSLPIRSFPVVPVFTNGVITDKKIGRNVLHPTVIPFAAANYRLTNDLHLSRWNTSLYLTGALGLNPNTVSADFATGPSLSWRAVMLSALCHFGHGVRLTQGLTVGESLGAGFNGSIPTQTYWTESFAIGLSIRVPSLTGR
jgi:hypothetical protein